MKILFVSQYFYPETFRGNELVFDLVLKGHDVTVLTGKPNYPIGKFYDGYKFWGVQKENINGAKVIRIPTYPRGDGRAMNLVLNYVSFFLFSYPYCTFKLVEKFEVIFVQQLSPITMSLPAIWAKKKNKDAKLYIWVLDLWPESLTAILGIRNKIVIRALDKLVRYIYSKADYILISSKSFEKSINQRAPQKTVLYFPNWAESVYEELSTKEFDIPKLPDGFNIMFAGNIGEAQDFETILNAVELTQNEKINWVIIGEGRKLDWVRKQVDSRVLKNVYIYGRYPIETMPSFFKQADVMLLTLNNSAVFNLTVPAKLQVYLSSGKIILGAINGEANSIINENKIGISTEAGNYKALAENALVLKSLTKEHKIEMGKKSRDLYYSSFSKRLLLDNLEKTFKQNSNLG